MYEVQLIAFLMQFGMIGCVLYLMAIFQIVQPHARGTSGYLVILYLAIFFAASYFNPYMLGSYAGLCMVVIAIIVRGLSSNQRERNL